MADGRKSICVITPYYKEDQAMMTRCIDSVRRQTVPVDHILVADGFPQAWLDGKPVRHIKFDKPHGDFGNAARGIAAVMAIAEGYSGICFLDADNWYDDDHIESCLAALNANPEASVAAAQRRFVRPDCSVFAAVRPAELPRHEHIDTNCYLFQQKAFPIVHVWATMPKELAVFGDHLFYLLTVGEGLKPAIVPKPTVNYLCMMDHVYIKYGEEPPPGARSTTEWSVCQAWLNGLSPEAFLQVKLLTQLNLFQEAAA